MGSYIGSTIASSGGPIAVNGGRMVGGEVGEAVIAPVLDYVARNSAYSYETPYGTMIQGIYGSTYLCDNGLILVENEMW
jgi:hypothetical protein